jgi:predicted nucleic acid-binding Zn ribbon protein
VKTGSAALTKTIIQHKHCVICRKVCSVDQETCSPECDETLKAGTRKKKIYYYLLWAMMAVFVAILIVQLRFGF